MIIEDHKNGGKLDKLLVDLCECIVLLCIHLPKELIPICVPCLLKVALNTEESEETQNGSEMALLALSNINPLLDMKKELYLKDITEIIKYHQEHRNLKRLSYQSAWMFLINRKHLDDKLEDVIVNELHFAREATRELDELLKCVDWSRKEEGPEKTKEVCIILRWCVTLWFFFHNNYSLNHEEYAELVGCLVRLFRVIKVESREIRAEFIHLFEKMVMCDEIQIYVLLKGGVVDLFLEDMCQTISEDGALEDWRYFLMSLIQSLKEKTIAKYEEKEGKKIKMQIFEKFEEEGYEDAIIEKYALFVVMEKRYNISRIPSDYFVHL
ncbi:uncharacterized protein MONOS_4019 [Monocercomonoides exilis]|uniref:uncharacterized protein n=1 Tax=Monocercomonoides exilis TaxID=2049356 RepID=UPI003559B7C9|nr:hypothetical protein MONOS_4019 [Monocercomonoides exilis]|eukprot:MONOS_4019.1-p1 / transcript=MONOS_4019.1 / gene=MONOS_4019 / organism=Monocercomonoides_exilis_PA203 / gene_product=unspecified product / transcript_product=unspecified product / location=Mono_scaffold00101:93311-94347(+) / protein_length=325 / sequence_SO=supercontig / SO=protein_coding / is_pseudo=false